MNKKYPLLFFLIVMATALSCCGTAGNVTARAGDTPAQADDIPGAADTPAQAGTEAGSSGDTPAQAESIPIRTGPVPEARDIVARACEGPAKAEAARAIMDSAISRFPPALPHCAGIEAVYICEGLASRGVPVPAASTRIEGKAFIFVDAGAPRRIDVSFTHELFHALEFKNPVDDEAWARINPYESYLRDTASPGETVRYAPNMAPAFEPGFVSDYARFSAAEDRAEIFSMLYSGRALGAKERTAMLSDPFLLEKIAFIKKHLDVAGLGTEDMEDNLFSAETRYFCRAFELADPGLARTGPGEAYPPAGLEAGQLLADSGMEKDGLKMLYDTGFSRVYAPLSALAPIEGETLEIALPPGLPPQPGVTSLFACPR